MHHFLFPFLLLQDTQCVLGAGAEGVIESLELDTRCLRLLVIGFV